ncbi:phosphatase PAP2 family protein [Actinacidiphila acididurans]|uniref:Phosphatase PAP2 family protein n=1 Tax=Actinacidiphila acididurans TaxID=2784346 RepID=A0ABS2TLW5_9ACTN|nr:phosphatase PAP2 family protein [Actinacidiphila acididurans]MBM9503486.1 phosphatase PAP2 family protein [Actinacidiphila acididurans]
MIESRAGRDRPDPAPAPGPAVPVAAVAGPEPAGTAAGGPRAARSAARRLARTVTDVLAPANVLLALLLTVGWHGGGRAGIGWALAAACVMVGVPLGVVVAGVRAGRYTDLHVRVRRQRAVPLTVAVASALAVLASLPPLGAPRDLVALVAATAAGLTAGGVVTVWWKVSGHTAVAGAATVILTALYGPGPLPLLLAASVLTGWSRVALADHTRAQTVVGFAIGAGVCLAVYVPLHG